MGVASTYVAQQRAAIRTSFADRANFGLQVGGMAVNNGFWLVLWWLFFAGFRQVGGWVLSDVARLLGVVYVIFGASGAFFGGYRDMAGAILRGELDAYLTQPKPVLSRMLARDSIPSSWGDVGTGLIILAFSARLDLAGVGLVVAAIVIGMVAWLATTISFGSLAFWFAGARSLSRDLADFTLMIATYPSSIYTGWAKIAAFTVLPAGFVGMAPVTLVREPSPQAAAVAIGGALGLSVVATLLFSLGLSRYRKGAAPGS